MNAIKEQKRREQSQSGSEDELEKKYPIVDGELEGQRVLVAIYSARRYRQFVIYALTAMISALFMHGGADCEVPFGVGM